MRTLPKGQRLLVFLPNQDGFRFIGHKKDGNWRLCTVYKDKDGVHKVRGAKYQDLVAWEPIDGHV